MSDQKAVPKGLRGQDVERGHTKKPPIPYIPLEDEIGEKVKADPRTFKVKVDGKTTVNASVWMGGSQEGFLIHVIGALNYCDRTKLFAKWRIVKNTRDAFQRELDKSHNYVRMVEKVQVVPVPTQESEKGPECEEPSPERTAVATPTSRKKPKDGRNHPPAPAVEASTPEAMELERAKVAYEQAQEKVDNAHEDLEKAGTAIFALYENLLGETALLKWNKIVASQIGTHPWTDLKGESHDTIRMKTVKSFKDCVKFHLLTVFSQDAAERQKYYINVHLRKPAQVTIRHFADRVEQLNSYLDHLPGLIDSPKAIASTKKIQAFDEAELSQLLLRMCHPKWQDQYNLTQGIIPQNLRNTIGILENIEQFQESTKNPGKPNRKTGDNGKSNNKKRLGSPKDGHASKKSRNSKNCDLCKKHGGAHMTHNTGNCKRYNKDGSAKKGSRSPVVKLSPRGIRTSPQSSRRVSRK